MNDQLAVVKFGSELVTDEAGVRHEYIYEYASSMLEFYGSTNLVVVTSGAVAAGSARVLEAGKDIDLYDDATLAQLGSASIISAWEQAFSNCGVFAGGLLVTHHELEDRSEGPHFVRRLKMMQQLGGISIVNANDALSDAELMELAECGDNDGLASHIARRVGACSLDLFTKNGGIMDDQKEIIHTIQPQHRAEVRSMLERRAAKKRAQGEAKGRGKGGILTKFDAADAAASEGVITRIANIKLLISKDESHTTTFDYTLAA